MELKNQKTSKKNKSIKKITKRTIPTSVDWRTKGAVTPIQNQGQCGSSPFFSAVVSMEGVWQIPGNPLVKLSEQQILDCDSVDQGCNGGWMDDAFKYVIQAGGIESEKDYPYNATQNPNCLFDKNKISAKFSSYIDVTSGSDQDLTEALTICPVASAIDGANGFEYYQSGVFNSSTCTTNPDHGIGIVGYGVTNQNVPYYILKNSWGTGWGLEGYVWTLRTGNMCGIASVASYIVV